MDWRLLMEWVDRIAETYHINPFVFGVIYFGAMPLFMASLWWLMRCLKRRQKMLWPTLSTGFWFCSSYLYIVVAGRNIPWWIYLVVAVALSYGSLLVYRSIRRRVEAGT